ncbi:UDP-N-acetylmuramoyl-L-alanine--D-glutamate ligase [Thalassotalea ponticola]|uniref:UDP-N-acetylmuramoyl-L-alanine--D-glutamate ligase n=1 Tax=Thalassotalea ponticola TaxID=1523392 RepID=UPI0025B60F74|nr:UDP-N-acetylmuramoyl-L-alanine--D-glutamate ligase [Thalassotalea ponticola]MDN3653562.1 UDP-N-acetylmuramoyl-L-alanine--D-glutamate ligase [Thalassotalea ponticola]
MTTYFKGKKVLILGLGATGIACARYLTKLNVDFRVNDSRVQPPGQNRLRELNPGASLLTGKWHGDAIAEADVLIASPGVDINDANIRNHVRADAELIGDVELYCRANKANKLAVTGSNGKSTVVSVLHHLANYLGVKSILAGNIGLPVLEVVDLEPEIVILELSSFQLETMTSLDAIAGTVLNICDDHLDRHKSIENYTRIKHRIYQQSRCRVYSREQVATQPSDVRATDISFGLDQPEPGHFGVVADGDRQFLAFGDKKLINCQLLPLAGTHNHLNCLAALALGHSAGWPVVKMAQGLLSFEGLAHRCKPVPTLDGITWINDSKATNIGATLAAIDGLQQSTGQLILIAGGDGKGANFDELKPGLAKVDKLITLGKDGSQIAHYKSDAVEVEDLHQAVQQARKWANTGDVVLLSPACASIDMFNNYMHRGDVFIEAVREIQ